MYKTSFYTISDMNDRSGIYESLMWINRCSHEGRKRKKKSINWLNDYRQSQRVNVDRVGWRKRNDRYMGRDKERKEEKFRNNLPRDRRSLKWIDWWTSLSIYRWAERERLIGKKFSFSLSLSAYVHWSIVFSNRTFSLDQWTKRGQQRATVTQHR